MGEIADYYIEQYASGRWGMPYKKKIKKEKINMAIIEGIAMWACVQSPNTKYEPVYSIDVVVDEATAKVLKGQGLIAKRTHPDDESNYNNGEIFIKVKKNAAKKDGTPIKGPIVVDRDMQPFTDLIGNGSKVKVQYSIWSWSFGGKPGKSANLIGIQVMELVPYNKIEFENESTNSPDGEDEVHGADEFGSGEDPNLEDTPY